MRLNIHYTTSNPSDSEVYRNTLRHKQRKYSCVTSNGTYSNHNLSSASGINAKPNIP